MKTLPGYSPDCCGGKGGALALLELVIPVLWFGLLIWLGQ